MVLTDWIVIGLLALFAVLGMLFGFGKGLKIFTGGIFGIIISIFICYALGGLIYNIGFVQRGLNAIRDALTENGNGFCRFLLLIQIDIIVYYVALFIVVSILRIILVRIIKSVVEIDNMALIIVNKTFGVIYFVGVLLLTILFVFWIIGLFKGGAVPGFLEGSKLKLDWLYEHNPFMTIVKVIKARP